MNLKLRVLAEWNIPITDPRVGKMNLARWLTSHYMLQYKQRRDLRRWSRFFGNDMTAYQKDEEGNPVQSDIPDIFPLAGIMNPEAFHELTSTYETTVKQAEIHIDKYEEHAKQMEQAGLLTDIDALSLEAEKKVAHKKANPDLSVVGVTDDPLT